MWAYAKDPQSFRYNARMHPMTELKREEFDEIVVYLQYISRFLNIYSKITPLFTWNNFN